ncbi:MAG: hypothetical protein FJZ95_08515 [Chloroflexi bacterium]|nr:hypothetical protein [Chloroflexota bacterium]
MAQLLILCELIGIAVMFGASEILWGIVFALAMANPDRAVTLHFNLFGEANVETVLFCLFAPLATYTLIRVWRRGLRERDRLKGE